MQLYKDTAAVLTVSEQVETVKRRLFQRHTLAGDCDFPVFEAGRIGAAEIVNRKVFRYIVRLMLHNLTINDGQLGAQRTVIHQKMMNALLK